MSKNRKSNRELKEMQLTLNSKCKACELMKLNINVIFDIEKYFKCNKNRLSMQRQKSVLLSGNATEDSKPKI